MAHPSIGTFTPKIGPGSMTIVRPEKKTAVVETYSSVAYFGWPASIVGKVIELTWNWMDGEDFNALDTLYAADAAVVFNPGDGLGKTYNVNILSLDGKYYKGTGITTASIRTDVVCRLLIMSQVTP